MGGGMSGGGGGGGGEGVPTPPTVYDAAHQWRTAMPEIWQTELEYGPKIAQQNYELLQKYMPMYSQLYQKTQEDLYPYTSKLRENISKQATEGMTAKLPNWEQNLYRDVLRGETGANAGSPIGANYMSLGLLDKTMQKQDYWTNVAINQAGGFPLNTTVNPPMTNWTQGFQPQQALSYVAQNYGSYSQAYATVAAARARASQGGFNPMSMLGGIGGMMGGGSGGGGGSLTGGSLFGSGGSPTMNFVSAS